MEKINQNPTGPFKDTPSVTYSLPAPPLEGSNTKPAVHGPLGNLPELNHSRSQNIQKRGKTREGEKGEERGIERGNLLRKKCKEVPFQKVQPANEKHKRVFEGNTDGGWQIR